MVKRITVEFDNCDECPYSWWDMDYGTRCGKSDDREVYRNPGDPLIPDWRPLPAPPKEGE